MQVEQVNSPAATAPLIDMEESQVLLLPDLAAKCRVLLVEDDELVLQRLSALLQRAGYETHTATSGNAALRLLDGTPCQIVVTDWSMPEMDGLTLCGKLRAHASAGYIYIVMLTVRGSRTDIVAGLAAGADDYVVKGATADELMARVGVGRRITHLERSLRTSNRENRRMSITDPLTGVRNRHFLMKYLPRELERARRTDRPLAVLSCDIDHFKRVNDTFGHEAGDEVLQEFAKRAAACVRHGVDWVARSGGEEFVLVLPDTRLNEASLVADRVRQRLAADSIATRSGLLAITVSIGISALQSEQELSEASVLDLLRSADRGLYTSKRLGRDRTTAVPVDCEQLQSSAAHGDTNEAG